MEWKRWRVCLACAKISQFLWMIENVVFFPFRIRMKWGCRVWFGKVGKRKTSIYVWIWMYVQRENENCVKFDEFPDPISLCMCYVYVYALIFMYTLPYIPASSIRFVSRIHIFWRLRKVDCQLGFWGRRMGTWKDTALAAECCYLFIFSTHQPSSL